MSAAVVSGAAALLLEASPKLRPAEVKLLLQLTSSRVEGAGLIEAGAGSLNIAAAVAVATSGSSTIESVIAGEPQPFSGIAFSTNSPRRLARSQCQ